MNITKENLQKKFLPLFLTVVGTVIALASLPTLGTRIMIAVIAIIIVLGIILVIPYLKSHENMALKELANLGDSFLHPTPVLEVRTVRNDAELHEIADLDKEAYGEHSVDFQGLSDWWQCYKQGVYALFRNRKLIGAVGIWPLTKNVFDMLVAGKLQESNIRKDDICEISDKQIYWYFGDIIIAPKYRGQKLSLFLLRRAAREWIEGGLLSDTVELCALAATSAGRHVLEEELGFHHLATIKSPDGLPIYRRTALVTELIEDLELWQKDDGSQSAIPT